MSLVVPQAVQKVAREARVAHQRSSTIPEEVSGVAVAEALGTGRVDAAVVKRMRRFFAVQGRHFANARQLQHTFGNSALVRAWQLHGGQAGRAWSERIAEDLDEEDPYVELLRAPVEEVYARLSLGAWRWEYGMDAPQAARFVEEYHRATGTNLDLDKAFGSGRNAVAKAMMRRAMNESPFKQLAAAIMRDEYRKAASLDLRALRESVGQPALNWSEFVGFVVLGAHARETLDEMLEGRPPVPLFGRDPFPIFEYSSPVASYVTYFHPQGTLFERASVSSPVQMRMARLMHAIEAGELRNTHEARQTLREAALQLGRNHLAGGVAHVLLEAWVREDWSLFDAAIPLDSPVRAPFERFW